MVRSLGLARAELTIWDFFTFVVEFFSVMRIDVFVYGNATSGVCGGIRFSLFQEALELSEEIDEELSTAFFSRAPPAGSFKAEQEFLLNPGGRGDS